MLTTVSSQYGSCFLVTIKLLIEHGPRNPGI